MILHFTGKLKIVYINHFKLTIICIKFIITSTVDETYQQLKEEAVSATGQVNFLNSVIVELQEKNQQLQQHLAAMEDSGIHTNGDLSEAVK